MKWAHNREPNVSDYEKMRISQLDRHIVLLPENSLSTRVIVFLLNFTVFNVSNFQSGKEA